MTRRFEFEEGSSSKFWEVSVSGSDMTVSYGRIGTSGQSKTKTFASPEAAQKEADSLIKEKTKKGYQEVGGAAPAATSKAEKPAPAPAAKAPAPAAKAPAPAAKAAPSAPASAGPEGGLRCAIPAWAAAEAEPAIDDRAKPSKPKEFALLWGSLNGEGSFWSWPSEGLPARVRPRFTGKATVPAEWDRELEAYALVLVRSHSLLWGEALTERTLEILTHWASRKDPVEALRTWLRSSRILCRPNDAGIVVVPFSVIEEPSWREEEMAAVRELIRQYGRAQLEPVLREELPRLFRDARSTAAFLGWLLDDPNETRKCLPAGTDYVRQVLGVVDRAEDVVQTVEACRQFPLALKAPAVLRAIARHGVAVADAVLGQCERVLDYRGAQVADKKPWVAVAACYPSPRAAQILVRMLEDKANRKLVGEALANMPHEAIAALEEARGKKIKHKDAVEALISTLSAAAAAPAPSAPPAAPSPATPAASSPAAPSPAAAASAPDAPSTVVDGETVYFSPPDWAAAEAEPALNVPMRVRKAGSFDDVFSLVFRRAAEHRFKAGNWKWGEGGDDAERALLAKAQARFASGAEGEGFDVDLEAYTLALGWSVIGWNEKTDLSEKALAHWTGRAGPAVALRTLLRAGGVSYTVGKSYTELRARFLPGAAAPDTIAVIRAHLRQHGATPELVAIVRELVDNRAWAAWILDDEQGALAALDEPGARPGPLAKLVALVPPDRAAALLRSAPSEDAMRAVLRHGLALAPAVLSATGISPAILACYPSAKAARHLVSLLEDKPKRKAASDALANMPTFALAALHELDGKKIKYRDAVDALLATLGASAAGAAGGASTEPVEEAPTSALPRVLQAPPWRQKKRAKETTFPGLATQPVPPALDLSGLDPKKLERELDRGHTYSLEGLRSQAIIPAWNVIRAERDTWLALQAEGLLARIDVGYWAHDAYMPGLTALLHRHGLAIVPVLVELAPRLKPALAAELEHAGAVEIAPLALTWLGKKNARKGAIGWARRFPRHAAAGLLPIALGEGAKATDRERAMQLLAYLKDERPIVLEEAARFGAEVVAATTALLDRDPLESAPGKPPKLFDGLEHLPRITLKDGRALPIEAQTAVLEMLAFSPIDAPYAGLDQVKDACDARSLDTFVEGLVRAWVAGGQITAQEWAVRAVALVGSDRAARFLFDRGRAWANDNQKTRAMLALDVLGAMGTDLALSLVGRVSRSGQRQYMKDRAVEILAEVAEQRGLSPDELEDRTAPDLGLDENGSMVLDFGPRKFVVGFDEHLVPFVKGEDGERLDALPRVSKTDDAEKAKAAWEAWKLLRSEADKVAKDQIARLERLLGDERKVDAEVFEDAFVKHPLVGHLTRRLVWGAFDPKGTLLQTFRVAEDRSYATVDDDAYALPADARVGLMHPIRLNEVAPDLTARWGQVLADYAIVQPFGQLARPTQPVTMEQILERASGKRSSGGLLFGLRNAGWRAEFGEYADILGYSKSIGSQDYRLRIDPPLPQANSGGTRPESHRLSLTTVSDPSQPAPSAVQLVELLQQIESIVLR